MSFEPIRGKSVLVTGGTGFLGGRLVERLVLELGADVRVLVRNYNKAMRVARFDSVRMIHGDVTDDRAVLAAAEGCGFIFHCAHEFGGTFPRQNLRINVGGTKNVMDAAEKAGARMVHVSSVAAYGLPEGDTLDETVPLTAKGNLYAEAKRRTEEYVKRRYRERPIPVSIVQPTIIYGPYASWTMGTARGLRAGRLGLIDEGRGCCNPVYVDDVVDGMLLAATRDEAVGESFLISGPDAVSWQDWYRRHEEILGVRSAVPMTMDEIQAAMNDSRRQRTLRHVLRSMASDGTFTSLLGRSLEAQMVDTAFRGSVRVLGDVLFTVPGFEHWDDGARKIIRRRRAQARARSARAGADGAPGLPPEAWVVSMFRSRVRVSIDKARRRLGYEPKYDFDRGMELTAQFMRWANL